MICLKFLLEFNRNGIQELWCIIYEVYRVTCEILLFGSDVVKMKSRCGRYKYNWSGRTNAAPVDVGPVRIEFERSYRLSYCRYRWRERTHRTRPLESHSTVIRREDLYLYRNLTALSRFSTPPSLAGRSCYISCQPSTSVRSIWTNE